MLKKIRSFIRSVWQFGLGDTLRGKFNRSLRQFADWKFERRYNISTGGNVALSDMGIAEEYRVSYEPSIYRYFHRLMDAAALDNFDGAFIDFGSGKGRALVSAAIYPFRQVIGVEISEALQIVARQNIQRALPKLACKNIELVTCDAGEYELPDDVIVIYFFNPFFGPILSNVLQHVHDSFGRVPRNMVIICVAPGRKSAFSKEIAKHGWLTKTFECDFENGGYGAIYVARE